MNWLHMQWFYVPVWISVCFFIDVHIFLQAILKFYLQLILIRKDSLSLALACSLCILLSIPIALSLPTPLWFLANGWPEPCSTQSACRIGLSFCFFYFEKIVDPAIYRVSPGLFLVYEAVFISSHLYSPHVPTNPSHREPSAAIVLSFFLQVMSLN